MTTMVVVPSSLQAIDSFSPLHRMQFLNDEQSWKLLREKVYGQESCPQQLEEVGKIIARNCKGLPLTIVVISGLLKVSKTRDYWNSVAKNINEAIATNDDNFYDILSLSYNNLPHHLKACFLYLGIFPEDYRIPVNKLIKLWVAEGFLKPKRLKSLEEVAEEYLEDLVNRSLVLVTKKRSNGRIRFCSIHDVLRELSIKKGHEEMFLQHYRHRCTDKYNLPEIPNFQRRLIIHTTNVGSLPDGIQDSPVRSLLYFSHYSTSLLSFTSEFLLLRVLDGLEIKSKEFPSEILDLVKLKYLAFTYNYGNPCYFPATILKLKNLQTLIVYEKDDYDVLIFKLHMPSVIWKMPQLRHLVLKRLAILPIPEREELGESYSILHNLQTLHVTDFKITKEVIERLPNLKKLRVKYFWSAPEYWPSYYINNLVYLQKLQELNFELDAIPFEPNISSFPQSLQKLTLKGSRIPCEKMSIIGSLPNLEVLKLMKESIIGKEWEIIDDFSSLKHLEMEHIDLENWIVESDHFPCLERLIIRRCHELKEVPESIGDISTLQILTIRQCNFGVDESVRKIEEKQRSLDNDDLKVHIVPWDRRSEIPHSLFFSPSVASSFGPSCSPGGPERRCPTFCCQKMKRNFSDMANDRGEGSGSDARAHPNVVELEHEEMESDEFNIQEEIEELNTSREIGEESPSKRPKRKPTERRAKVWDHFTLYTDKNGKTRAKCKYCEKNYAAHSSKNGTSTLNNHLRTCKNHPQNTQVGDNQTITSYCHSVTGEKEASSNLKIDSETIRRALVRMIIIDELPFKFVENEGFRYFVSTVIPHFMIPSRSTITRDCYKFFFDEKNKLKTYFRTSGQRLSLTTDAWTSNQRLTYMCLTGHYIDDDWRLHKVILNFIPCPSHKGDEVGLLIEKCLLDWGIDKVFAITVDNASSNDTTIAYLKRRLVSWGTAILGGKFLHMRCVAHIINLVVKDGLKDLNDSIERVRTVVRYVRQSPVRLKKFKDYAVEEKVESKKSLSLDVPTRWNSVYIMLQTALIFQGVFERYEISDADFRADFLPGGSHANIGLPDKFDWTVVERFVKVLQYFYELTIRVSGSLFVTSNTFLDEISDVDDLLKDWLNSDDDALVDMARRMKAKFDKYWGNIDKMNMMLYVAVMLDPRHKFNYLLYVFKNMYGSERGEMMGNLAKSALYDTFEDYKKIYLSTNTTSTSSMSSSSMEMGGIVTGDSSDTDSERRFVRAHRKKYQQMISEIGGMDESELDMYLHERIEKDNPKFDVLDWWKVHSLRFPILSRLARDVLAMPISTVASESTFSTGGRVIDDFRASLTPKMAQSLICCQDWLRHNPTKSSEEDYDFIQNIERDFPQCIGTESSIIGI